MLKPGTYKLSRAVENPCPDRRQRYDWRVAVLWPAGSVFLVEPIAEEDTTVQATRIILVGAKFMYQGIHPYGPTDEGRYKALEDALVPCEQTPASMFAELGVSDREYFARWLVDSGRLTPELFRKLWAEFDGDDLLKVADPYPVRRPLVLAP